MRSPTSTPRGGASAVGGAGTGASSQSLGYGFASQQPQQPSQSYATVPDASLQYQSDFPQEVQRQQQFAQYGPNMMYNIQQQGQAQSPYDPVPQYQQSRQSGTIEVISNQFGVPQYYSAAEATSVPGPSTIPQQYATAQFTQYQQQPTPAGRATQPIAYATGMAEYVTPPIPEFIEQQETVSQASRYDVAYNQYIEALKETFQNTRDGRLIEAGQSLLDVSEWLLGHAADLGLTRDEQELHAERIKLWNDFNTCWLTVLQRQKDITQEMLDTGQPPPPPQSILQEDFLNRMGRELIRLCDGMERHGLVDYQMGVWEEEIISVLTDCLDLLETDDEDASLIAAGVPPTLGSNAP
ncbi:MAG: hypothetical protein MMC33_004336 [Icmadophila ericetorum]|nr:hypothetical protein [Icmadophila ericetorum]